MEVRRKAEPIQYHKSKFYTFTAYLLTLWSKNFLIKSGGKSHEQRRLSGYSLWDCKELDMTEHIQIDRRR